MLVGNLVVDLLQNNICAGLFRTSRSDDGLARWPALSHAAAVSRRGHDTRQSPHALLSFRACDTWRSLQAFLPLWAYRAPRPSHAVGPWRPTCSPWSAQPLLKRAQGHRLKETQRYSASGFLAKLRTQKKLVKKAKERKAEAEKEFVLKAHQS